MDNSLFEQCGDLTGLDFDFLLDPLGESDVNSGSQNTIVRPEEQRAGADPGVPDYAGDRRRKRRFEQRQQVRRAQNQRALQNAYSS